jgi:hypothetical protein
MLTLEHLSELEDEFYGNEDDDGVFEDNDSCAEWARDNVDTLFSTIRKLLEKEAK